MLNSGDVFAGFAIERMLGQGGMGSVYLARHPRLPRQTALKLLNRELFADAEVRARFEREADLAAQLDHPNIVAVYDRGTEDEQLWISMQYVDGIDAATVNPQNLPPERAVQIIEGVAAALDYAHGMGVLHRDVKPANIMLARSGGGKSERVFLTDFGIARLREDSTHLTQTGMFTATLAYASPEQMTGAHVDHGSDQYSLACSLYWLLTGSGPFDAPNPADIIRGHLQLAPPPVGSKRHGLNPALDLVLARAMAKRPVDRFASCSEFAAAARQALTATVVANPAMPQPVAYSAAVSAQPAPPVPTPGPVPVQGYSAPQFGPQDAVPGYAAPAPAYGAVDQAAGQGYSPPPPAYAQPAAPFAPQPAAGQQFPPPPNFPTATPYGTPPPRRQGSNTGLIVGICAAVLVVIVVAVVIIANVSGSESPATTASSTSSGKSSGAPAAAGSPTEPQALGKAFPQVVPQVEIKYNSGYGDGYHNKKCFFSTNKGGDKLSGSSDVPDFKNWASGWNCWGTPTSEPDFLAIAFKSPADAQAAVRSLPANTKTTETKGGKSVSAYRWQDTSNATFPEAFYVVSFENDPAKSSFLFFAHVTLTDKLTTSTLGLSSAQWRTWCADVPL
ncbi:serine/threonine-protein kinase [Nocardia sp. NPDC052566]|uniref:serine/threonine-protein kinase n=1 Tax=Nocardia sp. NPDC052566 TaxID=3364330 RepID=UPI0037CA74E0